MLDHALLRSTIVYVVKLALAMGIAWASGLITLFGLMAFTWGYPVYGVIVLVLLALPLTVWLALKADAGKRWLLLALVMTPWLVFRTETIWAASAIVHFFAWWLCLCVDGLKWRFPAPWTTGSALPAK